MQRSSADENHHLARVDREIDLAQNHDRSECLCDLPELDDAHRIRILFSVTRRINVSVPVMIR
jgi:hypothetical protein